MELTADSLMTPEGLGKYVGVPTKTVYKWNSDGTGPRFSRIGRHVRYRVEDVQRWIDDHQAGGGAAA